MNKREKRLLIALGVGIALLAGRAMIRAYRGALQEYNKTISRLTTEVKQIEQERMVAAEAARQWREEIGPQTLSMDAKEAATRLRDELYALSDKVGLADITVNIGSPQTWLRNGLNTLNGTVSGTGTLDVVVDFLFLLHRQPYNVRCQRLTLDQATRRPLRGRADADRRGLLKMTAQLDTLILPPNAMVQQFATADLAAEPRETVPRTVGKTPSDYQALLKRDLFAPYLPPPPERPPRVTERSAPDRPPPTRTPPPPPPPDARMVLGRTLSSPRGQLAVLEEPVGRGRQGGPSESTYKQVGDTMYGGTLVFVHPRGAVTEREGKLLFHPLGEPLNSGKELSAKEEPIVYHELLKLKEKAKGISERPG